MKPFTKDDILKIALLAQLEIPSGELDQRLAEFNSVLTYCEKLNEIDLKNVPVTDPGLFELQCTPLFDDKPQTSLGEDAALSNAPDRQDAFFKVPRILGDSDT